MTDKIADIRARQKDGAPGQMPIAALCQCDADREFLLAEVERLRAVISTLEIVGKAADDERARLQKEVERLHKAHETACLGGELLRGEVERLREENERLTRERNEARAEYARLCDDIERIENDAWHDGAKHGTSH